jgi:hypothetical protein
MNISRNYRMDLISRRRTNCSQDERRSKAHMSGGGVLIGLQFTLPLTMYRNPNIRERQYDKRNWGMM